MIYIIIFVDKMLPRDCLNVIASFCSSKVLENMLFTSKNFYHLINDIHFWINKCQQEKIHIYIKSQPIGKDNLPNMSSIKLIRLYDLSYESFIRSSHLLCEVKDVPVACQMDYITKLPLDALNDVKSIVITPYDEKYTLQFKINCNVTYFRYHYNNALNLLSYHYINN